MSNPSPWQTFLKFFIKGCQGRRASEGVRQGQGHIMRIIRQWGFSKKNWRNWGSNFFLRPLTLMKEWSEDGLSVRIFLLWVASKGKLLSPMQFIGVSKHEPLYASCKEGIIRRNETTNRVVVKGKTERLARPRQVLWRGCRTPEPLPQVFGVGFGWSPKNRCFMSPWRQANKAGRQPWHESVKAWTRAKAQKRDTNFSPLLLRDVWEKSFRVRLLFRRTLKSVS